MRIGTKRRMFVQERRVGVLEPGSQSDSRPPPASVEQRDVRHFARRTIGLIGQKAQIARVADDICNGAGQLRDAQLPAAPDVDVLLG